MVGDFQRFILHTDLTRIFYNEIFEHEIRRRPTDRREVIKRIKRIIYCTRISRITRILVRSVALTVFEHASHELNEKFIAHGSHSHGFFTTRFLNTNRTNYTNILLHTDLTDLCLRQFLIMGFLDL